MPHLSNIRRPDEKRLLQRDDGPRPPAAAAFTHDKAFGSATPEERDLVAGLCRQPDFAAADDTRASIVEPTADFEPRNARELASPAKRGVYFRARRVAAGARDESSSAGREDGMFQSHRWADAMSRCSLFRRARRFDEYSMSRCHTITPRARQRAMPLRFEAIGQSLVAATRFGLPAVIISYFRFLFPNAGLITTLQTTRRCHISGPPRPGR